MKHRTKLRMPRHIYPADPWKIIEKKYYPKYLPQTETLFSTANGYFGLRGVSEEGRPVYENGTFINGFYDTWPITYGEEAFGFAKTGQTMVNVTDSKIIKLYVDDEPFFLPTANLIKFERTLDMKNGTLDREVIWEMSSGKRIMIKSKRLVSLVHRHIASISYEVTVLNSKAPVVISSEIVKNGYKNEESEELHDPRKARKFPYKVLESDLYYVKDTRIILCHSTKNSKLTVASGIEHKLETKCTYSHLSECSEDFGKVVFMVDAKVNTPINLTKYITYHTNRTAPHTSEELRERAKRALSRAKKFGFSDLLKEQKKYLNDFWETSDIKIETKKSDKTESNIELQQAIRYNLFQICQSAARSDGSGIPSKGLTGQAYEGHYFWDMDIYLMPFLTYTKPLSARNLLKFRYNMLDKAREYARNLNQKGAMFPWRTINGEEASAYYAAGTAQYHINADIIYALKKYVDATGDVDFLYEFGAEMLVETARLWCDIGFYSNRNGKYFNIHGVTGPDEYNTVVYNNFYTNIMAKENLLFAASTIESVRESNPDILEDIVHKTNLDIEEINDWKKAAEHIYLPYDKELGIHAQDDNFLTKEKWDFENTPIEKYPLLLNYHPLVIYRHQVIKQADLILAIFLLRNQFSESQIKSNFNYYDPITTGDSSLSVSIQSIVASMVGQLDKSMDYAKYSLFMDLCDVGGNTRDGCHIASMGGSWMIFVFGFAGFTNNNGKFSFNPKMPDEIDRIAFNLNIKKNLIEIIIDKKKAKYTLRNGKGLELFQKDKSFKLSPDKPTATLKI